MATQAILIAVPALNGNSGWIDISALNEPRTLNFQAASTSDVISVEFAQGGLGQAAVSPASMTGTKQIKADNSCTHIRLTRTGGTGSCTFGVSGVVPATGVQQFKEVTITHAQLTAGAMAEDINLSSVLPPNAQVLGIDLYDFTPFSGGGAAAVAVTVGSSGDKDAIIGAADLFAAAVDGGPASMSLGIRPFKLFPAAAQLLARFIADVNVADLSAGSVTFGITFVVQP